MTLRDAGTECEAGLPGGVRKPWTRTATGVFIGTGFSCCSRRRPVARLCRVRRGRLPRDLIAQAIGSSPSTARRRLVEHAREADSGWRLSNRGRCESPPPDGFVELVTGFMSLHDMDDLNGTIKEAARVTGATGTCASPSCTPSTRRAGSSRGRWMRRSSFAGRISRIDVYADTVERDGLRMTFTSRHRPLQSYFDALETVGMTVERLVEVPDETDSTRRPLAAPAAVPPHSGAAPVEVASLAGPRRSYIDY